jgi:hypothetical protein
LFRSAYKKRPAIAGRFLFRAFLAYVLTHFPFAASLLTVIPAKTGIHASNWRWIPAFAGMTVRSDAAKRQVCDDLQQSCPSDVQNRSAQRR